MPTIRQRVPAGRAALVTVVSLTLGACAVDRVSDYIPSVPSFSNYEWNPYSKASFAGPTLTRKTVTPADYVNADGSCAGTSGESASAQQVGSGVALQMTECDVLQVLGPPQKIDIGTNERGDRSVTILYNQGERRGLYHFTAGQLTLIERVDEPAPAKPQKPAPKPRRSAA